MHSGDTQGTIVFQIFDINGTFVGATEGCHSAPKSVHVTADVTTLAYVDKFGNPVDVRRAIGRAYIKMAGLPNDENNGDVALFISVVSLYKTANSYWPLRRPNWKSNNNKLKASTIIRARRNASNDALGVGQ